MLPPSLIPPLQIALRAGLAAALAVAIAQLVGLPHPIYAMIAAVIVTDLSPAQSQKQALPRIVGTLMGAVLGAVLCLVLPPATWSVGVGIALAVFISHLVRLPEAAKLSGYLCAIVLLEHAADAWYYAFDRFVETLLGVAVALLVSKMPKLLRYEEKG